MRRTAINHGDHDLVELAELATKTPEHRFADSLFGQAVRKIEHEKGPAASAASLRHVIRCLVKTYGRAIDSSPYPDHVKCMLVQEFCVLQNAIETEPDESFDIRSYVLRSRIRLACLRRIPVGNEYIEISGLPRRFALLGGVSQAVRFLRIATEMGGTAPVYELHLASWATSMSRSEREACLRTAAGCLECNPEILGLLGCSWFYDPVLRDVSPKLRFVHDLVLESGGVILKGSASEYARRLALAKSPTRRKRWEQGTYLPRDFAAIWSRQAIIRWSHQTVASLIPDRDSLGPSS